MTQTNQDSGTTGEAKKPAAAKKSAAKNAVLIVRGPVRGRWRAGRHFGAQPVTIPLKDLTKAEAAAIRSDPALSVREES